MFQESHCFLFFCLQLEHQLVKIKTLKDKKIVSDFIVVKVILSLPSNAVQNDFKNLQIIIRQQ